MKNKGITLIALVITIIILLILAGITISQLGDNGLINKVKQAELENKRAQYYEEINLEIYNSQIDLQENPRNEVFITILADKIKNLSWVDSVIMCDDESVEHVNQDDDSETNNTVLIITTKDGYEMYLDVDNQNITASIRKDSFSEVKEKCIITYDKNTGDSGTVEEQSIRPGFSVILRENKFEKSNYTFIGWSKDKVATKDSEGVYAEGSKLKIEENTTLYAVWKSEVAIISFDSNTGEGTMEDITVGLGIETALPINLFTKENYEFVKWNTKADGTGDDYTDTIAISEDITLYAIWKKGEVTISFASNSGTGTMNSMHAYKGEETSLPVNTFTKENYEFAKWNTKADGTGADYTNTITTTEDKILFAIWNRKIVTITLNKNDGTTNPQTISINVNAGESNSLPLISNTFTRDSYHFLGWSTTSNGNVEYDDNANITIGSNITLYAKWLEDRTIPQKASINITSLSSGTKVATVTHTDNESGIDIENCKYYFSTNASEYGINNSIWNSANTFEQNGEQINLELDYTQTINNSYLTGYLHVLSVDKVGNKRETISSSVKLEIFTINTVYKVNTPTTNEGATATTALNTLFNGNTTESGVYKGLLFASGKGAYMEITVNADMTIYAYGGTYSDSGGSAGKKAGFARWNGSSYNSPTKCNTTSTATRYKLISLTKGKYKVTAISNYVVFSEWEIELD